MKERIAITGSGGIIGTVLTNALSKDYEITQIDLPGIDVRNYVQVLKAIRDQQAIIHLAWDSKIEHCKSNQLDPDNRKMYENIYNAALEAEVKRVIMASSIHADNFYGWVGVELMSPYKRPEPQMPYGEDKVVMENMGRDSARKGLEVVSIRFGGINPANIAPSRDFPRDMATWLSHKDCVSLVDSILKAKSVPNGFVIVYGVSNNEGRVSDISNPFGWKPREKAEDFTK